MRPRAAPRLHLRGRGERRAQWRGSTRPLWKPGSTRSELVASKVPYRLKGPFGSASSCSYTLCATSKACALDVRLPRCSRISCARPDEGSPCVIRTTSGACRPARRHRHPLPDLRPRPLLPPVKAERSYCIAATRPGCALPRGMSISAGTITRSLRSYGDLLIVGGEGHAAGSGEAHPARFERLAGFARAHWASREVTHRWSAQDPVPVRPPADDRPVYARSWRLWVSSGFMKWGLAPRPSAR